MARGKIKIRLQGHEKFVLRDGWLNKGIMLIEHNPFVFQGQDAPDIFGLGNNMVKSLRYWLKAYNLIEEKGTKGVFLTDIAKTIVKYDKYFEDIFTIWILHSNIAKNIGEATTWYMFFNCCDLDEFDKDEIIKCLKREIFKYTNGASFAEQSLKNDVDILLNMYGKERGISDPEDKNISPMVQLGLIKKADGMYTKGHPDDRNIYEWNILYELASLMKGQTSISIEALCTGEKSLSAIYQISRITINEMLDKLNDMEYIRVDRTAGLDMVYKLRDLEQVEVAEMYYQSHR